MKKKKNSKAEVVEEVAPVAVEPALEAVPAEAVEEKKGIVNCPKCSTALHVKVNNVAYLCPVCSYVFRTRMGEKLVKDVTQKRMVEAFVTVDQNDKGEVKMNSTVSEKK